ncbi:type I-G CRISPR-associated protein Csb2 [Azospirillum sp. sgz301742]
MLALAFTFPAGRYHATPWGRHVNEADVAWPPEPWRILRALVATWLGKADRTAFGDAAFADLIDRLAERPPDYALPEPVVHAHSRHYMPQAAAGDTKLVFDAFARFPAETPIVAIWPDLTLTEEALALLRHLAERIGYLGRAESWAECRVWIEPGPWPVNCRVAGRDDPRDDAVEDVRVIAPLTAAGYREERGRLLAEAGARVRVAWTKPKPPTDNAVAKQIAPTAALLPERLSDALEIDTGDLQRQGWSRPPASREVLYRRAPLSPLPRHSARAPRAEGKPPTVARFVLAGRPRPRVEDTVKIGELMRLATMAQFHGGPVPSVISGKDADGRPLDDPAHGHAFWLPEDADGDGFIDHVVVHAAHGFDDRSRAALDGVTRLWVRDRRRPKGEEAPEARLEWRLALEGFGTPEDFKAAVPFLNEARHWVSVTPFLAAGHLKGGGYPAEVRRLLVRRGIVPADRAVEVMVEELASIRIADRECRPVRFHRFRAGGGGRSELQPDAAGRFLRVSLPEARRGPFALGYASHFGLGLFRPEA